MTQRSRPGALTKPPDPPQTTSARHLSEAEVFVDRSTRRQPVPEVHGYAAAPAGRRTLWAIIVPQCTCGYLHIHRATGPHGGLRIGSCGQAYRIVLAGGQRGRWGA